SLLKSNGFSVNGDIVGRQGAVAKLRDIAADGDTTGFDPAFDFATGSQPGCGQELLQPLSRWCRWRGLVAAARRPLRDGQPLPWWRAWVQGRGSWRFPRAAAALRASAGRGRRGIAASSRTTPA